MKNRSTLQFAAVSVLWVLCGSALGEQNIESLIAHWTFDEGAGETAYDLAGDNHGTIYGAEWTNGQMDSALSFDGIDDYVATALNIDQTGSIDITMVAWAYPTAARPYRQQVISTDNGGFDWSLLKRYGTWRVFTGDRCWNSGFSADTDRWQHVAAVFRAGEDVVFYKNGVSRSRGSAPDTDIKDNPVAIGDNPGWWSEYFEGRIDEVRIYDRALSAEEIEQLYQDGLPELLGLEIIGPDKAAENFVTRYKAIAHYDNDSTADITDLAVWSVEPNDIAGIDENGVLATESTDWPEEDITVYAQYSEGEITVDAAKEISVFALCPTGTALELDGVDDYVDCGNDESLDLTAAGVTVQAWVRLDAAPRNRWIVAKSQWANDENGDYWLNLHPANTNLNFAILTSAGYHRSPAYTCAVNQWYHLAGVFDGASLALYVNGESAGPPVPVGGWVVSNDHILQIGGEPTGHANLDGTIDEVVIYNRVLSAEEIRAHMHKKLSGDELNLVGYWDFDEGEGQVAYDLSDNGNHGQLGSTPHVDDSDPAWVQSNAPVGICTNVPVDIKPGSCPNPLNVKSRGVLPVAVLGTQDVDVNDINVASIRLAGVAAIRSSFEDVASPLSDPNECECTTAGPDGYTDLTLKFRTQEIVEALGEVNHGDVLTVTLTGVLEDGTPIKAVDCIVVRGKFRPF